MKPYTLTDAESDYQQALRRGADPDELYRLAAILDRLDISPPHSLAGAALWYAEHGLHVFRLQPGAKIPYKGSRGFKDATIEADQLRDWWKHTPEANIGLATGHLVDVVDIDGPTGQASRLAHWGQATHAFDRIEADALGKVLTPTPGGMHIYVPATGRGNATNIMGPGSAVDYRGHGGYVVAPPSRTPAGTYRWLTPLNPPAPKEG